MQTRGTDPERAGGLRQTSVAIFNIDTDVTDKLKWKLRKPNSCRSRLSLSAMMVLSLHGATWFGSACVWTFDTKYGTSSRRCDE